MIIFFLTVIVVMVADVITYCQENDINLNVEE